MGAGKSTNANSLALELKSVLLSDGEWLKSLFADKITSLDNYIEYSNRLKPQIKNSYSPF